ncbi:DNA-binding transcriptional regulator [uncultured Rubinisphaera sp.]|uniref:AraC family transcriptional regulator n=1 Tax=uncultured Rubinisphaera sp. TaxID=1678686 RepID=UPI0030DC5B88
MIACRIPAMNDRLRIALLVLNASQWSRSVVSGIVSFADEYDSWDFWLAPRNFSQKPLLPSDWSGQGIIARIADEEIHDSVKSRGIPCVNVSWHTEHSLDCPKVISDPKACGRMAAEYYVERGFESFAYIGPPLCYNYNDPVLDELKSVVDGVGGSLNCFDPDPNFPSSDYDFQRSRMRDWIHSLPKPVGLIAWSTNVAREIMLTSLNEQFEIPNDIAILAIEHEPTLSSLCPFPISYVQQSTETVGFEAAKELQRLMNGGAPREAPILIQPEGIVEKTSTDTIFTQDDIVQEAVAFIRRNSASGISVDELTRALNVSRRSLEERFRRSLNRTPADEIRSARLEVIKSYLKRTTLSLSEISDRTGFSCQNAMLRFFKRLTSQTPGQFRRNYSYSTATE